MAQVLESNSKLPAPTLHGPGDLQGVGADKTHLRAWWILGGILLLAFVGHLCNGYDFDELMHLHTAWNIGHGRLPYRDFYENHLPLFHILVAPCVRTLTSATVSVLVLCRCATLGIAVMWLAGFCALLSLSCARSPSSDSLESDAAKTDAAKTDAAKTAIPISAIWGVGVLILTHPFATSALEFRPDWLAMVCLQAGMLLLLGSIKGEPGWCRGLNPRGGAFLGGLLLGAGICMTQKAAIPAAAIVAWSIGSALCASDKRIRLGRIAVVIAFIAGIVAPLGLLIAYFARQNALEALYTYGYAVNTRWGQETPFLAGAQESLLIGFPLFVLAVDRVLRIAGEWRVRLAGGSPDSLIALVFVAGVAAFLKTPVPYLQWFLFLVAPWTVYLAVVSVDTLISTPGSWQDPRARFRIGASAALCLLAMHGVNSLLALLVWGALIRWKGPHLRPGPEAGRSAARVWALLLSISLLHFIGRTGYQIVSGNLTRQSRFVAAVDRYAAPGTPVLCTWPVMAPFHPFPTYHWFVTGGIYPTLSITQLQAEYIKAIREHRVRLIVSRPGDMRKSLPVFARYLDTSCHVGYAGRFTIGHGDTVLYTPEP